MYLFCRAAYREQRKPPKWTLRFAYFLGAIAWTWILLGIYYEPEHIYVSWSSLLVSMGVHGSNWIDTVLC